MGQVACVDDRGKLVLVPASGLQFGVSVHGLLIENDRILVRHHPATALWEPPGGLLAPGQTPEQGMRSLFRAQSGLICEVGSRLLLEEEHRLDGAGQAWQLAVIYFALRRSPGSTITLPPSEDNRPAWIRLRELSREGMYRGYDAIQTAQRSLADNHS